MDEKNEKKQQKSEEEILRQIEMLSKQSDEQASQPLDLFAESELLEDLEPERKDFSDTADPEKSYELFYSIQRILKT